MKHFISWLLLRSIAVKAYRAVIEKSKNNKFDTNLVIYYVWSKQWKKCSQLLFRKVQFSYLTSSETHIIPQIRSKFRKIIPTIFLQIPIFFLNITSTWIFNNLFWEPSRIELILLAASHSKNLLSSFLETPSAANTRNYFVCLHLKNGTDCEDKEKTVNEKN